MTSFARAATIAVLLGATAACQGASGTPHASRAASQAGVPNVPPSPPPSAAASAPAVASSPTQPTAVPGMQGYLYTDPDQVIFLLFAPGTAGGTSYTAEVTGTPPTARVVVSSFAFVAETQGKSLTLEIDGHTDYGTITTSGLALNVLQSDGSLQRITYSAATPADYNDALTQLKTSVANADTAQAQAQASASAAAAARVQAELSAGKPTCDAIKGSLVWATDAPICEQVPYLGTDGSTYYSSVDLSASGALLGPMDTAGKGATQQECVDAYYPDLSTGPGRGPVGTWNASLKACLP